MSCCSSASILRPRGAAAAGASVAAWPVPDEEAGLIQSLDDLLEPFFEAGKPAAAWRIGAEAEKFGVDAATGAPVAYHGLRGIVAVFEQLEAQHGWQPVRERPEGPVIALARDRAAITLEPGAQLELSGAPWGSVHQVVAEFVRHRDELEPISRHLGLAWLAAGFHPLAAQAELPWVPKERYAIMREYLPAQGRAGLDMMRRTATIQVNLDYADEQDAMRKLRVALKLAPVVTAMFADAPFVEGRRAGGRRSVRADVWLDVDPDRTGLLPQLMRPAQRFVDYVQWALDVPMFLFKRHGHLVANTGQTFRSFWHHGFGGHRATRADWELHLNTLFPEVRLKRFLELRSADAVPGRLLGAVPALWTGLLYDEASLAAAEHLTEPFGSDELEELRRGVGAEGLAARLRGRPVRELAERVVDLAAQGLGRRQRWDDEGRDEIRYLTPIVSLVEAGQCPADQLLVGLDADGDAPTLRAELLRRTTW